MSGTIATDSNLSASGTITLSLEADLPLPIRYNHAASNSVSISSLEAGTYAIQVTLNIGDTTANPLTFSVSGASSVVALPQFNPVGVGKGEINQGIYTVSSTGTVTVSTNSGGGIDHMTVVAIPVTA